MNVGVIANGFPPQVGGLQQQVRDVVVGLGDGGVNVSVLAIRGRDSRTPADGRLALCGGHVQVSWAPVPDVVRGEGVDYPVDLFGRHVPEWREALESAQVVCGFGYSPIVAAEAVAEQLGVPLVAVVPGVPERLDDRTAAVTVSVYKEARDGSSDLRPGR